MSEWKTVRLGDVATYINGYAFKPSDWGTAGLPIIRIQNLTGNDYETNFFNGEIHPKYKVKNGDVLISWSASLGVYEWNKGNALLNQHIFKVVFDKIEVDKKYFIFTVSHLLNEMAKHTHGSTMRHITKPDFDNMPFPLPSIKEQKKISELLEKCTSIIATNKQMLEKYDMLIKSRFIEMFGDPVINEKDWDLKTLPELGEFGRGVSKHRPRNAPELLGGKYPLIQTGDVANANLYITDYESTYSEEGFKQSKMWKAGTLCITIAATIAKTAILTFDSCFPDSVVGFTPNEKTNSLFINYWFSFFQKILEEQAPAVAQKNINLQVLSELKIITPPISLQNNFAAFVQQINKSKFAVQKSLEKAETLYKSLMQEYFG